MPSNSRFPLLETSDSNSINTAPSPSTNEDGISFLLAPTRRSINTLTTRSLSPSKFLKYVRSSERRASSAKVRRENSSLIPDKKPSNSCSPNHFKTTENSIISPKKSLSRSSSSQQKTQITIKKRDSDFIRKSQTEENSPEKHSKKDRTDHPGKSKINDNKANLKLNKHKTVSNYVNKIQQKEVQIKIRDRSASPINWQTENQPPSPKKTQIERANIINKSRFGSPIKDNLNTKARLKSPKKIEEKSKNTHESSSLLKWLTEDLVPAERCSPPKKPHLKKGEQTNNSNRITSPIEWTIEDLTDSCRSPKTSRNKERLSSPLKCQLENKLKMIKDRLEVKFIDRSSSPINLKVPENKKRGRSSTPKKQLNEENEKYNKPRGLSLSRVGFPSPKKTQNQIEHPIKNTSLPQEERTYISRRFRSTSASPKKSQYSSPKKTEPENRTKIVYAEEYLKNKRNFRFSAPFRRTTGSQCDRPNRNKAVETSLGTDNMAYTQEYGVYGYNNSPCNVYKFLVQLA